MSRRKRYSAEFKRQALRRADEAGVTDALVCEELGISARQMRRWRDAVTKHGGESAFPGHGKSRDEELTRLKRELTLLVRQMHLESNGVYGARKLQRELLEIGEPCGRHKVARLMRESGLKGCPKRRFRRVADASPGHPVAANLLKRDFTATRINERWAADITFISTHQGWLFLAVVMDLYSRRIVGWSMDRRIGRHLVLDAMTMALGYRQPSESLLHHSDRGPQYTSDDFRDLLAKHGIQCSMSARGSCYDNAPVESFFSSLKRERIRRRTYRTREEAKADVFDYIECFYNRKRRHAYLGYISPAEFENKAMMA